MRLFLDAAKFYTFFYLENKERISRKAKKTFTDFKKINRYSQRIHSNEYRVELNPPPCRVP